MQIQFDHIAGSECPLREAREEEFVDDPCARDANGALLLASQMRCHNHAAQHVLGSHRYLRTIVETAYRLAFWTLLELVGRQVQTCLNERVIEHGVLFATGHKGEARKIRKHGPSAVLSIEPEQGAFLRKLVYSQILTNGCEPLSQFLPVAPIAPVA